MFTSATFVIGVFALFYHGVSAKEIQDSFQLRKLFLSFDQNLNYYVMEILNVYARTSMNIALQI